jgi:hypothetical protein
MYSECCEGGLDPDWKVDEKDRLSFQDYRLQLSEQMLMYDPKKQVYQGDGAFRKVTKLGKRKKGGVTYWKGEKGGVSIENFKIAKSSSRYSPLRLCGPLDELEKHMARVVCRKNIMGKCAVCGSSTYWKCGLCNEWMCIQAKGSGCHISLHNDSMFGLTRCDFKDLHGGKLAEWKLPNI